MADQRVRLRRRGAGPSLGRAGPLRGGGQNRGPRRADHAPLGYITSLRPRPAAELAAGIRRHWGIENKLHRARDVQFRQDTNGIRHARAAANVALFNTFALNFLLANVHPSLSFAQIMFAQNIKEFLISLRT